ncbi:MAG: hypothetical protein ACYC0P_07010 [Thiobacillus sp.]|jgi:hypothetical protein
MIRVSCRSEIAFRKLLDCNEEDDAIRIAKERMRAAAIQIASDLVDDGYSVELDVNYLVAYEEPK